MRKSPRFHRSYDTGHKASHSNRILQPSGLYNSLRDCGWCRGGRVTLRLYNRRGSVCVCKPV